jgi:hypothetical protein
MEPYATCYGGHQFGNWAANSVIAVRLIWEVVNKKVNDGPYSLKVRATPYSEQQMVWQFKISVRNFYVAKPYHWVPTTGIKPNANGRTRIRICFTTAIQKPAGCHCLPCSAIFYVWQFSEF